MKLLLRIVLLALLAAVGALRLWLATLGLAQLIGVDWALALALGLLLIGMLWPLQIAVFCGALLVWHWPPLLALMVAAPRLILMLPGLISTFLAARRHPRPRWGPYQAA
jgi:hypothetical protein